MYNSAYKVNEKNSYLFLFTQRMKRKKYIKVESESIFFNFNRILLKEYFKDSLFFIFSALR